MSYCSCRCGETCCSVFGWFFQISTWIIFGIFIMLEYIIGLLIVFLIVYIIYLIIEFRSPSSRYLFSKNSIKGTQELMAKYFRTPPVIDWSCESYHFETVYNEITNSEGEVVGRYPTKERVNTHSGTGTMKYRYARDISGPFILKCDNKLLEKKYFIKLQISQNIDFADQETINDYQRQKKAFISANALDEFFDFDEKSYIPGVGEYLLVKICEEEPACVNFFLFFIFTLLTLAEFYKIYYSCFCIKQDYTIKKIISTRYNLNRDKYNLKYQNTIPVFNFTKVQYTFQPSDYNCLNGDYPLPSQKEVENANNNINNIKKSNEIQIWKRIEFKEIKQNDIKINIINQKEINSNNSNLPPASPLGEYAKSEERLNNGNVNYLTVNAQNKKENDDEDKKE